MEKLQFRILYREFLFRVVDLELLAPDGDMRRLLGQFAAVLLLVGSFLSLAVLGFRNGQIPRSSLLIGAWGTEHALVAATMLTAGVFAGLTWDSAFPDQRDILALASLPVKARTLLGAKVAAMATALGVVVGALNVFPGLSLPFALTPTGGGFLAMILSVEFLRLFAAYWITMISAAAFIFCSILCAQGVAMQLLPYRQFLRLSAFLQMAALCLLVSVYFLQPPVPPALMPQDGQPMLAWLPSYWFLWAFQELNGSMPAVMSPFARRAWLGLAVAVSGTVAVYGAAYFRALRKIIEEPAILPGPRGLRWPFRFGNSVQTAIVQFSVRTLLRSRQHRVLLAFFLGIGSAIVAFVMKLNSGVGEHLAPIVNTRLLYSSLVIMGVWIAGTRVAFSMPFEFKANWIFRVTAVRDPANIWTRPGGRSSCWRSRQSGWGRLLCSCRFGPGMRLPDIW